MAGEVKFGFTQRRKNDHAEDSVLVRSCRVRGPRREAVTEGEAERMLGKEWKLAEN